MAKPTALLALESLRLALLEQAEIRLGAAYQPGVTGEIQAQARGEGFALQEAAELIAKMQAEGFSDPDPIAAAETARRTVQNCLNLNNVYQEFFEALVAKHGREGMEQLVAQSEMMLCFMLHWHALNACFSEQGAEQQIADVKREIERLRGQTPAPPLDPFRSSKPIQ